MGGYDEQSHAQQDQGPPDEPGLESEGIGPLGLVIGGITEGFEGIIHSEIADKIIEGGEAVIDHFRGVEETAPPPLDLPEEEETSTRSTWTEHDS